MRPLTQEIIMKVFHTILGLSLGVFLTSCATIDWGTAVALTKLAPEEIDPRTGRIAILWPESFTHYRPPFTDFEAEKDKVVQLEGRFTFVTDPDSENFVPRNPNAPGELIVYAVDESQYAMAYEAQEVLRDHKRTDKLFGGADWKMDSHTDFSFTVAPEAYSAYCAGEKDLDVSIWVKANSSKPFQRLVDDKGIDNFLSGQLKGDCNNPDSILITRDES